MPRAGFRATIFALCLALAACATAPTTEVPGRGPWLSPLGQTHPPAGRIGSPAFRPQLMVLYFSDGFRGANT